jgi:hypothetical protein
MANPYQVPKAMQERYAQIDHRHTAGVARDARRSVSSWNHSLYPRVGVTHD